MSYDVRDNGDRLTLTGYWGGDDKGPCIQITGPNCDQEIGYVGLTLSEAKMVAAELALWAEKEGGNR